MTRTTLCLAAALIAAASAGPVRAQRQAVAADPPVEPSTLFSLPTGRVVRSMDIDLSGTGVMLSTEGSRPLYGAVLGLGDIAQLEMGTIAIVSGLTEERELQDVQSAGLKVFVPLNHYVQGLAASFRRSASTSQRIAGTTFDRKVGEFYTMATVANYPEERHATNPTAGWKGIKAKSHVGLKYVDAQMEGGAQPSGNAFWRPVVGLELWKTDARARIVGEVNWIAGFEGAGMDGAGTERVEPIRVVTAGVRYFFSKHVTLDIGVRNQSDYDGLAESAIQAKVNFSIPTHSLRDRIVGN
jgi:hypothetical protein